MKVHFITSRGSLENDVSTLHSVTKYIKESGHALASDWIDAALDRLRTDKSEANWKSIYKTNLENIAETDVVVAEVSYENFGVGYQVAVAVQQKKPVLLLRKESVGQDAFVTGVEDGWVQYREYNDQTLPTILAKFFSENDISTKDMRFNFFIDRPSCNSIILPAQLLLSRNISGFGTSSVT